MEINFKDEKSRKLFEKKPNHSKSKNRNHNKGYKKKDSFDIDKTKIPKDTRAILKEFKDIDNFNLKLNKFARFDITDIKKPNEEKFIFYRNKVKDLDDIEIKANFGNFEENIKKQEKCIKAIFKGNIKSFTLKTNYRLIIGAEESIYETSIRLHHIYGIPYIPASAIKGVVRSYMIYKYFEKELNKYKDKYNKFEEEVLFNDDDFKNYFGTPNEEGKIIFFDAFPISAPKLKMDIINPMEEDKIINFLTVENTTFKFFIASKESLNESFITLFKDALQNHGIGGKTAVGYGYFEEIKK